MTFLIGLSLISFVLYIFSLQISVNNRIARDRYRFQYFALRDQLTMLVCAGKIKDDSWEYKELVNAINFHIHAVDDVSVLRMAKMIAHYHSTSKDERQVRMIKRDVESDDVRKIMVEYLKVTRSLLIRNSKAQIELVKFFQLIKFKSPAPEVKIHVSAPKTAIERINHNVAALESGYCPQPT